MEEIIQSILPILQDYLSEYNNLYVQDENIINFIKIEFEMLNESSGIKILDKSTDFEIKDGIYVYFYPKPYILSLNNSKMKKVKIERNDAVKLIALCLFGRIITSQDYVNKDNEKLALNEMINILNKYNV